MDDLNMDDDGDGSRTWNDKKEEIHFLVLNFSTSFLQFLNSFFNLSLPFLSLQSPFNFHPQFCLTFNLSPLFSYSDENVSALEWIFVFDEYWGKRVLKVLEVKSEQEKGMRRVLSVSCCNQDSIEVKEKGGTNRTKREAKWVSKWVRSAPLFSSFLSFTSFLSSLPFSPLLLSSLPLQIQKVVWIQYITSSWLWIMIQTACSINDGKKERKTEGIKWHNQVRGKERERERKEGEATDDGDDFVM